MYKVDIKPLSVNKAWQGKRFKTKDYKSYESAVLLLLPKIEVTAGNIELSIEFGFSNKQSDIDNPVKCFIDCLQKKYGFNDRHIYKLNLTKVDVEKGNDYIRFSIEDLL